MIILWGLIYGNNGSCQYFIRWHARERFWITLNCMVCLCVENYLIKNSIRDIFVVNKIVSCFEGIPHIGNVSGYAHVLYTSRSVIHRQTPSQLKTRHHWWTTPKRILMSAFKNSYKHSSLQLGWITSQKSQNSSASHLF